MAFWDDLGDSFDSFNNAPIDNTHDFMDEHGEKVVKAFMIAALAYGLGGAGGGEAAAGGGGSGSSGALFPTLLQQGKGMLGNLGNMGGDDSGPEYSTRKRRPGILSMPSASLYGNDDPLIDPEIERLYKGLA